ncbi:hypothetical protein GEMRC1_011523 [Eukaryota sp. GEM-RC1]
MTPIVSADAWRVLVTEIVNEFGEDCFNLGFDIGLKIAEFLSYKFPFHLDELSLKLKMVSTELWSRIFINEPLTQLPSPAPSCVIWESAELHWLKPLPCDSHEPLPAAINTAHFFAGILQGGLKAFGVEATVSANLDKIPVCKFVCVLDAM